MRFQESSERLRKVWQYSLFANKLIGVTSSRGRLRALNPHQMVYILSPGPSKTLMELEDFRSAAEKGYCDEVWRVVDERSWLTRCCHWLQGESWA